MNILALSTSSPRLSVALKKGAGAVRQGTLHGFLTHAENLIPLTGKLLKEEGLQLKDIDTFLIDRGPGSFTGLRIGFATLKGWRSPETPGCFGALSLDIIAHGQTPKDPKTPLAVCLDAHREKIYFQLYRPVAQGWKSKGDPLVLTLAECLKKLPSGCIITGNALERYGEALKKREKQKKINYLSENSWYPKAATLVALHAENKLTVLDQPGDFVPLYFRLSEPEERKKSHADAR